MIFGKRQTAIGVHITLAVAAFLISFATGCATTSGGQVHEVEPGTYSVGILYSSGASQGTKAMNDAVDKAGEYCHSKGQKLAIISNPASPNAVTFRCGSPS